MADQEEDFSSLPLPERFAHKNWKVRKEGYEAAAKAFDSAQSEADPIVRDFISDSGLWKGAVADSNVAAQQEGMNALHSFLQISGTDGCRRTRGSTITPIVEKGLTGRPAAKQRALDLLLLYIELDKPDPVIEELIPILSHKQPKVIAATLPAITSIYHAYGCRTIEPKPVLKVLPKLYGHADKNVRAEAQNLTVELYRWLKEAMKPLFWNDLKPVQQQDLEKLFEKVKDEPAPKQERLLRSQQEAEAARGGAADEVDEGGAEEDGVEIDLEPEFEAVNVMAKVPKDFQERLASSKWKDRKEALDDLHTAINHPKIEEGPFDDIMRGLAKCMKDANIAVVATAANCVELFSKGLKRSFSKYRSTVMSPMMERLKEKKTSVTDAIGAALDAVFMSTSLSDCLEETLEFLKHKNPEVKIQSTRFLIRSLKATRDAPSPEQTKSIADACTKLLTESQEVQRSAGAEVLGTLKKIMGERMMNPYLEGLDDIRKAKINEYFESAEVKAKYKPKTAPAPKPAAAPAGKKPLAKKPGLAPKKTAPTATPRSPTPEEPAPALAPKPTSRPGVSKLAPKSGLAAPRSGIGGLQKKASGLQPPSSGTMSPQRKSVQPLEEEAPTMAAPRPGLAGRGLTGRPLGKPAAAVDAPIAAPAAPAGMSSYEKAELEELRAEVEHLRRQNEDLRSERSKMTSQIHELQNQNAQLIEDHTRDVLSIKAKETQLVRARSDAESAEQTVQSQQREVDRLKRELARQVRASSPAPVDIMSPVTVNDQYIPYDSTHKTNGAQVSFGDSGYGGSTGAAAARDFMAARSRSYPASMHQPNSPEGKENFVSVVGGGREHKLSPSRGNGASGSLSRSGSNSSGLGRGSPSLDGTGGHMSERGAMPPPEKPAAAGVAMTGSGQESWKRAAEVTQNLKARIELMKAKQGLNRSQSTL